jgi:Holliday junction resolvase RusA-like endonuclease
MIEFTVYGLPAPQGSKRYVGNGVMIESSKKVKPWREAVKWAAREAMAAAGIASPIDAPLVASMTFTMPRPKSAPKSRRHADRKPDLSKLIRSTEDALTDAGLIADDARIVMFDRAAKVYPGECADALQSPGARIRLELADRPEIKEAA